MFRLRALASLPARVRVPLPRTIASRSALQYTPPRVTPAATLARNYSHASTRPKTCPSCSAPLPTALPVCTKCSYIAPIPESMSYHEMLGVPYEPNPFVVNVPQLKNEFRAVQTVVHPDRWVARPPESQAIAAAMSSRVNEALHRLSNPLRRVEYILAREGHGGEETDKLEDMELLMDVMEAREGLASAESPDEVAEIRTANDAKIQETLQEIEQLVGAKDWEALRTAAIKLKYLQGIESAAAAWPAVVHDH
ncbi:Co-chaperone Hsc20 [Lentinus tigrinus ALCF2SS1-7]|uniref:Co-chaperone Hsc20 n=1 Tax=Lentinus tigrinus ALCF2SS1-6 TaxID=1328759 RepID=A0A5C2SGZ3_9APHY|nr:Co-chaperone Hsc20 [Lentinus tigrinus ALCF2SS1-6]RPD82543.1 Co-chaperone Hsc20 [Lentinus tigrinus ALCF2SS1-7]